MPDSNTTEKRKDVHTAITELVLYLKGDGTVSSVQKMIGIHRNMLSAIFEVYDAQMRGKVIQTKSEHNPRIKNLYWGTNSLITVAQKLGIPLSELIRAAEDIEVDGLPPWFQRRISRNVDSWSTAELGNIFLEALGCLTYAAPFPETEKNVRQYRRRDSADSATFSSTCMTESYTEVECGELKRIATQLLENGDLSEFAKAYQSEKINSKDAYVIMKTAVDHVRKKRGFEEKIQPEQLYDDRSDFVKAIQNSWNQRKSKRPRS